MDVQVRPAESAWKRFGVDRARAVAHTFQEILPRALPGACRVLKVRSWAAKTVAWMGVEDSEEGSITWFAHISGKDGSNVGEAEVAGFCVDTVEPLEMGEDTKAGKRDP